MARCVNGREALQAVRQHRPDVLMLDIGMPGMDGITVLRRLRREVEIVRMVAARHRNKEIGERLSISEGTVKLHLHHICR